MKTHILIPIKDIQQRYKELNDNRSNLSEYWLGELHGLEQVLQHHEAKQISLDESDIKNSFNNNFDCYADTREECNDTIPSILIDGPVVPAMTFERFKETLTKL